MLLNAAQVRPVSWDSHLVWQAIRFGGKPGWPPNRSCGYDIAQSALSVLFTLDLHGPGPDRQGRAPPTHIQFSHQ